MINIDYNYLEKLYGDLCTLAGHETSGVRTAGQWHKIHEHCRKIKKILQEEHKKDQERFSKSLEEASEVVKTWPKWKQNLLGVIK